VIGEVLGLDPLERRLVVVGRILRTAEHDKLECFEVHGAFWHASVLSR
jgi:hypothetical protein